MSKYGDKYKGTEWIRRPWNKDEVKKLITLWPNKSMTELIVEFQRPHNTIQFLVQMLRKYGVQLEKKVGAKGSGIAALIREVVEGK